jgi:hypothetical protein
MKYISIFILLILLVGIASGANTTTNLIWTKTIGVPVMWTDTNEYGTLVYAGLSNGSIVAYDNNGNWQWQYQTNASIKKIMSDAAGNIVWSNSLNETGYISTGGASLSYHNDTFRNVSDISITKDGTNYAFTELYPPRVSVYGKNGAAFAINDSFPGRQWSKIAQDPLNTWIITANQSNNTLYLWNVSNYTGWSEFNPSKTYNTTLSNIDSFPYRFNLSIDGYTNTSHITFTNNASVAYIEKRSATNYDYNSVTMGNYFNWQTPGNITVVQSSILNISSYNAGVYDVVFKPGYRNFTVYAGNTSYSNYVMNADTVRTSGSISSTGGTWTSPQYATSVYNLYIIAPGGDGSLGGNGGCNTDYPKGGAGGNGGSAGSISSGGTSGISGGTLYTLSYANTFGYTTTMGGGTAGTAGSPATSNQYGAAGGAGASGYGSSPTSGNGATGGGTFGGGGGAGGVGYGSGGGGGGGGSSTISCSPASDNYGGNGGSGSSQYISFSYYVDTPTPYMGVSPINSYLSAVQFETVSTTMFYVTSYVLVGNVSGLSVPEGGGWIAVSTDAPKVYHQAISPTGFGTQYSAVANTGNSYSISISDGASFSTEGRGIIVDIYDSAGTRKGSYSTGGVVRSVDIAQKTSLWSIAGGDDGKVYVFSKDALASWYVAYSGDSFNPITTTAMSWRGEYASVGRIDGNLEYYSTNVATTSDFDITGNVYKDAMIYSGQNITVYRSNVVPYIWVLSGTGYTDSSGRFTYSVAANNYYKFVVNNNEGETIYQATTSKPTIVINILSPSLPYEWNSYYDTNTGNVTVIYTDTITSPYVNISITDMSTGQVVATTVFTNGNSQYTYHDASGSGNYQVTAWISRNSNIVRDQRMVSSSKKFGITLPTDNYIKWGLSMLCLMVMAGLFGAINAKRGAFAVVAVAAVMIFLELLPLQMWTVTMLAAMIAVSSLLGSKGV